MLISRDRAGTDHLDLVNDQPGQGSDLRKGQSRDRPGQKPGQINDLPGTISRDTINICPDQAKYRDVDQPGQETGTPCPGAPGQAPHTHACRRRRRVGGVPAEGQCRETILKEKRIKIMESLGITARERSGHPSAHHLAESATRSAGTRTPNDHALGSPLRLGTGARVSQAGPLGAEAPWCPQGPRNAMIIGGRCTALGPIRGDDHRFVLRPLRPTRPNPSHLIMVLRTRARPCVDLRRGRARGTVITPGVPASNICSITERFVT